MSERNGDRARFRRERRRRIVQRKRTRELRKALVGQAQTPDPAALSTRL